VQLFLNNKIIRIAASARGGKVPPNSESSLL